jgi:hypothetical protein
VLSFDADEVPGLEDDVVARHRLVGLAVVAEVVVLGDEDEEDTANGSRGSLLDLVEDRSAGDEVRLPVEDPGAGAEQEALDRRRRHLRSAGVSEKHVASLV